MVTLQVISEEGKVVKAVLAGRLDTVAAKNFTEEMKPLMDNADKNIFIDCNNLEFISSSGLRLLLALRKETIEKGGNVTISGLTEVIKKVFVITGFHKFFAFN